VNSDVSGMSQATDTIATLRDLLNREYARHQATITDRNSLREKLMSQSSDNTVPPGNWGGYCQVHHLQFPCPVCTSAPQPQPFVGIPWKPEFPPYSSPPYTDPWMMPPFFPTAIPGYPCPTCQQDVPTDWDHDAFLDD
jgi:hypothetical protein